MADYRNIQIAGGDTAKPLAMAKRLNRIRRHLSPGDGRFLDCGCGAGEYVFQLVDEFGLDAFGVEFDPEKVRRAKQHPRHGHRVCQGDVQALQLGGSEWHYALLNEVLEHVPDDSLALQEAHRVLKPGGLLFIFSPNRWFPFETHGLYLKRFNRWVPPWFPFIPYIPLGIGNWFFRYWARNYWQKDLRQLVQAANFSIIESSFVWQTFEGISGQQPRLVAVSKTYLRRVADCLESTPFLRRFGVSQALVCRKT